MSSEHPRGSRENPIPVSELDPGQRRAVEEVLEQLDRPGTVLLGTVLPDGSVQVEAIS